MLKAFVVFDVWVIFRLFQPFAEWFQKLTGKTNFWLAKVSLFAYLLFDLYLTLAYSMSTYDKAPIFNLFVLVLSILVNTLIFWMYISLIMKIEKDFYKIAAGRYLNPEISNFFGRLALLLMMGLLSPIVPRWLYTGGGLISMMYFLACTPLPPAESKVRAWVRSFTTVLKPAAENN